MANDRISPIAPARIRALLLPVGRISSPTFQHYVQQLQAEAIVRLGDISPDSRPDRNLFSPLAFPDGKVLYDLSTSLPPTPYLHSSTIELFREILIVIAIANGQLYGHSASNRNDAQEDIFDLQEAMGRAREQFPKALSLNLLLFDVIDPSPFEALPAGTLTIPPQGTNSGPSIKTVMCDITAMLLSEMTAYANRIHAIQTLESLSIVNVSQKGGPASGNAVHHPDLFNAAVGSEGSRPSTPNTNGTSETSRPSTPSQRPGISQHASTASGRSRNNSLDTGLSPSSPPSFNDNISQERVKDDVLANRASQLPQRETSRDRKSILGQGLSSVADRAKQQLKTRQGLILGTLFLHAGHWSEALRILIESTTRARAYSDHLWHAKGLENILVTMLLLVWAGMDFQIPPICYPKSDKSFGNLISLPSNSRTSSDAVKQLRGNEAFREEKLRELSDIIPDLINMIMNIHNRAQTSQGNKLPQFAFSECVIRTANLMAIMYRSNRNLNLTALRHIIEGAPFRLNADTGSILHSHVLTKTEISTLVFRAMPSLQPGTEISISESLIVFCGVARVLSLVGLQRKRAFIVRTILHDLIPALVQARKVGAAEAGIHPAASLAALNALNADQSDQISNSSDLDARQNLSHLLDTLTSIYGIFKAEPSHPRSDEDQLRSGENFDPNAYLQAEFHHRIQELGEDNIRRTFGGLGLKTDILLLCTSLCEALPKFESIMKYCSAYLSVVGPGNAPAMDSAYWIVRMAKDEQLRLANKMSRILGAVTSSQMTDIESQYWDDFIVRGVVVTVPDSSTALTSRTAADLGPMMKRVSHEAAIDHGPFIFDRFAKTSVQSQSQNVIVAGEQTSFIVALQNLYDFEVTIEKISFVSEGVPLEAHPCSFILGPSRIQHHEVNATAECAGKIKLLGCSIKIRGCKERTFLIFDKPWYGEGEVQAKKSGLGAIRVPLLSSDRPQIPGRGQSQFPEMYPAPSQRSLSVIDAQPVLAVVSTSIAQSTFMILEGETKSFTITVQNLSKRVSVDFVNLSFDDSTLNILESRMSSNPSPAEAYEIEYQAQHYQALRWQSPSSDRRVDIGPGDLMEFRIEAFGKAGLTDAVVHIDYAYLGVPVGEYKDAFFTRHISLPVVVTVNASIQLQKVELLPLPLHIPWSDDLTNRLSVNLSTKHHIKRAHSVDTLSLPRGFEVSDENSPGHFMLILEVRNAWPRPLSLSIEVARFEDSTEASSFETAIVHEDVHPGNVVRIVAAMPRILVHSSYKPIPQLSASNRRQFVVSSSSDPDADFSDRQIFWYRQELLNRLRATWHDQTNEKYGEMSLRGFRLTARMLDIMKLDSVGIEFLCVSASSDVQTATIRKIASTVYEVPAKTSVTLKIRTTNRSRRTVRPLIRLQPRLANQPLPIALDLTRKFAWTGILQSAGPSLQPSQVHEFEFDFVVLCGGEFEIGILVNDVQNGECVGREGDTTSESETELEAEKVHDIILGKHICGLVAVER